MAEPTLLQSAVGPVTQEDIARSLDAIGVAAGDVLVVHSQLFSLGRLADVTDKTEFALGIIQPMLRAVGSDGGIMTPAFSFGFCRTGTFDLRHSPTTMGFLSEEVRKLPDSERTRHPIYSYALLGNGTKPFLASSGSTSFGPESVFDYMQRDGIAPGSVKLVYLGIECPPFACTYVHALEEELEVPYRYHKQFAGTMTVDGVEESVVTDFFVRDLDVPVIFDGEALWERWLDADIVRSAPLGDGQIVAVDIQDVRKTTLEAIQGRIDFMCKGGYAKLGTEGAS